MAETNAEPSTDADYSETQLLYNRVMEQALATAISSLELRNGWHVLDAGCGAGGALPLLHAAVAPEGTVVGLDIARAHVTRASALVRQLGLEGAVSVEAADLRAELPQADESFDAAWSADVLYPDTVGDPGAGVVRLKRVLKPGGLLAIFYGNWLRPAYLPGYARLEHLICAAREALYARERMWQGEPHPESALGWLERAGFTRCRMQVHPVLHRQPLPDAVRRYIQIAIFGNHYQRAVAEGGKEVGKSDADQQLWSRLTNPHHPDYALDQPEYYCTATALLAVGEKPR